MLRFLAVSGQIAWKALGRNRLRSGLTTLGVVIGELHTALGSDWDMFFGNFVAADVRQRTIESLSPTAPGQKVWRDMGVDVVVESTGLFTEREGASQHLTAGAKKVVISAPATDPDVTLVLGVNNEAYDAEQHHIISMASCTTGSVGPMAKILLDNFGLEAGFMTLTVAKRVRASAMSFWKSGPWNSLPTKRPPGARVANASSSARSNSASLRA